MRVGRVLGAVVLPLLLPLLTAACDSSSNCCC
jgi:hypothetical protein